jgi:hypothetical protein
MPFASIRIGGGLALITALAAVSKWLCLRLESAGGSPGEKTKPKRRGRGRGKRRRAARGASTGYASHSLVNSLYVLSLAGALAVLIGGPLLDHSSPPMTSTIDDKADVAPVAQAVAEPKREQESGQKPNPEIVSPEETDPAPTTSDVPSITDRKAEMLTAVDRPPSPATSEPQPEIEPAPTVVAEAAAKEEAEENQPEPTPELVAATSSDLKPDTAPMSTLPTPAVRPVTSQHGGLAGADTYTKLVQPILKSRCYSCHGEEKQKGDLRLDTPEAIRAGGKSGPVIIAGNPDDSYLFELISLEASDDDIMPPKGKPLSAAQISWIGGWIREGASLGDGVAWPVPEGGAATGLAIDAISADVSSADGGTVQALLDGGVIVRPLSSDGKLLEIDYSHADRAAGEMRLEELIPLAANIHTLDLKRTRITDADLKVIGSMANLRILHLQRTKVTDACLPHLSQLTELESLNLYNTKVSDSGIAELKKLTSLKKVFLWSTQVTADGARELAGVLGSDVVNMGE